MSRRGAGGLGGVPGAAGGRGSRRLVRRCGGRGGWVSVWSGRWAVAVAMLREHWVAYVGVFVVVAAASALVGSQALLFQASRLSEADVSGMSHPRAVWFMGRVYAGHLTAVMQLVVGGLAALVLVAQAVSVAVQGRRRELALLRLAGATPARVRAMVAREAFLLGLLASSLGAAAAIPGLRSLARLLASQNNWPQGFIPMVTPSGLVLTVVVMTAVTTAGALVGARGVARAAAVEAVRDSSVTRRGMTPVRWVVAGASFLLVAWVWMVGPSRLPWDADDGVALWVGGGVVVGLCALAPLLVGPTVRLAGVPVGLLDRGAALTAWTHTRLAARHAAAVVVPVAAVVSLAVIPVMASNLGSGRDNRDNYALSSQVDAAVHHEADQPAAFLGSAWQRVQAMPQAQEAVRAQSSPTSWMLAPESLAPAQIIEQARQESFPLPTLNCYYTFVTSASDPAALIRLAGPRLVQGRAEDVYGTGIALSTAVTREDGTAYQVGDSVALLGADGTRATLRVAALFETGYPLVSTRVLADASVLPVQAGEPVTEDWFLTAVPGTRDQLLDQLARSVPQGAEATTGQGWTRASIAEENRRGASNDATTVGGICVLAAAVMVQQTLALARSRRHEIRLLQRTGASRATVITSAVVQTAGLQLLGLAVAATALAATWAWLAYVLVPYYNDLTAPPVVPWLFLVVAAVVAFVVPQVTMFATTLRTTRPDALRRGAKAGRR